MQTKSVLLKKVPVNLYARFKAKCRSNGRSIRFVTSQLMSAYIDAVDASGIQITTRLLSPSEDVTKDIR
jgi:hypothetical protein